MNAAAPKERFDVVRFMDENCVALCVALALVALPFLGIAGGVFMCAVGALLCLAMLTRRAMRLDLWVFIPLLAYVVLNGIATFRIYGTLNEGYFGAQSIYLVIYLAIACVEDHEAEMMRKLCTGWAALVAIIALGVFAGNVLGGKALRLDWPFGNADPQGIFLVIAWFALSGFEGDDGASRLLRRCEPVILVALALTLTMASFGALVIGVIAMLLYEKSRRSWKELGRRALLLVARLVLGAGMGFLLYGLAFVTPGSWIILLGVAVVVIVAVAWERIVAFLSGHLACTVILAVASIALVAGAFFIRANAAGRFVERIAMIQDGIGYVSVDPLFGIGPFQWHHINHELGDPFPTAALIHSTLASVAVEIGLIALAALLIVVVRFFVKRREPWQRGAFIAFLVQNLFDLGFYFPAVTGLLMVTVATPRRGGVCLVGAIPKVINIVLLAFYAALAAFGLLGS